VKAMLGGRPMVVTGAPAMTEKLLVPRDFALLVSRSVPLTA